MNRAMLVAASVLVTACGGGGSYDSGGSSAMSSLTYTVGGMVSGLSAGKMVVLQNNGGNSLTVTQNGAFTFSAPINYATGYDVTVLTQPAGQTCTITNAVGAYPGGSVSNVQVSCT